MPWRWDEACVSMSPAAAFSSAWRCALAPSWVTGCSRRVASAILLATSGVSLRGSRVAEIREEIPRACVCRTHAVFPEASGRRIDAGMAHPPIGFCAISAPALFRSRAGPGCVPPLRVVSAPMEFVIDEAEKLAGGSWSSEFADLSQRLA